MPPDVSWTTAIRREYLPSIASNVSAFQRLVLAVTADKLPTSLRIPSPFSLSNAPSVPLLSNNSPIPSRCVSDNPANLDDKPLAKHNAAGLSTTIMPFAQLPACAVNCGPLYDANGACVPPAVAAADANTYDRCFCSQGVLQAFSTAAGGVCPAAGCDDAGFSSIQGWYTSFCNSVTGGAATASSSSAGSSSTSGASKGSSNSGNGGDW